MGMGRKTKFVNSSSSSPYSEKKIYNQFSLVAFHREEIIIVAAISPCVLVFLGCDLPIACDEVSSSSRLSLSLPSSGCNCIAMTTGGESLLSGWELSRLQSTVPLSSQVIIIFIYAKSHKIVSSYSSQKRARLARFHDWKTAEEERSLFDLKRLTWILS